MNRIIKINAEQAKIIKRKLSQNKKIFIAEVQGGRMRNEALYCEYMRQGFEMTKDAFYASLDSYRGCAEWMESLVWLYEKGYRGFALFIKNSSLMLLLRPKQRKIALEYMKDSITVDEENEGETMYPDNYFPPFNVYLETPFVSSKKFSLNEATDAYNDLLY